MRVGPEDGGIFGGDALRSLAAATPAEQVERIEAFDTYERELIRHVQGPHAAVAEMKPAQPKPLRLKVNSYEGKEGENLHFWVREVELAMDVALISTERLRVAFVLSNLGGRAKTWAYTRDATTPVCFTTWAQLCEHLRAAFFPVNYECRQRSSFLACKQGKRELHEYIQEMRVPAASLVGIPLPEHIKVTVFMDGLNLFRVHANTMEEAIEIALQEEYSHRQARTPTSGAPAIGASTGPVPMELGTAVQSSIRFMDVGSSGTCNVPALREGERMAEVTTQEPGELESPVGVGLPTGEYLSPQGWSADGARHGGLAPESLGALETRKSSGGLHVVHASERGYGDPFRILMDSGASTNFARRQTVARSGDKYADALRENEGRGQVSVRLADGAVVNAPAVRMDLAVKFEDFDNTKLFLVLDMDKYDLILSMPWLEKHDIGWQSHWG
ncbi:Gag protein [Phytophthora palmivora]|uniref:Gag protein n=1 Tax=Phytophthora palmivora TaxID=4796 RepID=A0A2P4X0F0_9STRA|nr:Gag protein [Phytophthora palmivora]